MDELSKLFREMKNEFSQKLNAIESRIASSEEKITSQITTYMNSKFEGLNKDLEDLRLELDNQEKRMSTIEKQNVQRNLVLFGVEEKERSYFQLQDIILNIINKQIGIKTEIFEIQCVRRFGSAGNKPRPISVSLTTLGKKIQIIKNKKSLEGSNMYIQEEFPKRILEIRKDLKNKQKIEIEKGNIAYLKYDKLIVKNKKENTQKRQLSESPVYPKTPKETTHSRQSHKKYRANPNPISSYMVRSENA
ncbi:jg22319 [Pararge aegeria aegeria]|uniref:Jg22319 protein n=1 Tax=Pararge aegeria aegeria TaxID=348720 RepID=A0A8S4QMP3_9NEOP|nr:jg22319 [Pararge aegeria aegeria]